MDDGLDLLKVVIGLAVWGAWALSKGRAGRAATRPSPAGGASRWQPPPPPRAGHPPDPWGQVDGGLGLARAALDAAPDTRALPGPLAGALDEARRRAEMIAQAVRRREGHPGRWLPEVDALAREARLLAGVAAERADPRKAGLLRAADRLARAVLPAPCPARDVIVHAGSFEPEILSGLAVLPVAPDAVERPWELAGLAGAAWELTVRTREDLARAARERVIERAGSDPSLSWQVAAAWTPRLLCDAAATLVTGPAHARHLDRELAARRHVGRDVIAVDGQGQISEEPPLVVRRHLVAEMLRVHGLPEPEAPEVTAQLVFAGGGIRHAVPAAPFFDATRAVAEVLQTTPFRALDGRTLAELTGERELVAVAGEAERLSVGGGAVADWQQAPERTALAALGLLEPFASPAEVLSAAGRFLAGSALPRPARQAAGPRDAPAGRRAALREAVLVHELLIGGPRGA